MSAAEIDPLKVAELQAVMGAEFEEIIAGLVRSIDENIGGIEQALAASDLETTYRAAHHCRNDALMVKARALLKALETLEQAARDGRLEDARAGLVRVHDVWPPTREALEQLAGPR